MINRIFPILMSFGGKILGVDHRSETTLFSARLGGTTLLSLGLTTLFLVGVGLGQKKDSVPVVVCRPVEARGPSRVVPIGGKCGKGYKGIKDKEDRLLYCVNEKPAAPPVECKKVTGGK